MKNMKIAVFTETFLPQMNGVVRSICNTINRLEKTGYSFCVFAPGRKASKEYGFCGFRSLPFLTYPEFRIALPSKKLLLTHSKGISLVHSRGLFSAGYMAKYLSKKKHVPIIGTFDTPIHQYVRYFPLPGAGLYMKRAAEKYTSKYFNMCSIVTAPSETARQILLKLGCRKRIEVATNGVDAERFSPKAEGSQIRNRLCRQNERLLLYVGRIAEEKRIDVLLKAMKELRGERIKLAVVGKGPRKPHLETLAKNMNLDNVLFAGPVPDQELPKYYAACDLFVSASPVETEGLTFLEAMSTGKPIMGPDAGASSEIIRAGLNGEKFQPENHKDLSEKIRQVLASDIPKMGENCLEIVREKYSLDIAAEKIRKIYDEFGS